MLTKVVDIANQSLPSQISTSSICRPYVISRTYLPASSKLHFQRRIARETGKVLFAASHQIA